MQIRGLCPRYPDSMGLQGVPAICIFPQASCGCEPSFGPELGNRAVRSHHLPVLRKESTDLEDRDGVGVHNRWSLQTRPYMWKRRTEGGKKKSTRQFTNSLLRAQVHVGTAPSACIREIWLLTELPLPLSIPCISSDPHTMLHLGHRLLSFSFMNNLGLYLGNSSH